MRWTKRDSDLYVKMSQERYIVSNETPDMRHIVDGDQSACGQLHKGSHHVVTLRELALVRCKECLNRKAGVICVPIQH
jgi:hypothetical protein